MNVLLVGHACGPDQGSEPGITWNLAWFLSLHHRIWLLTHPERRDAIEAYLREHPNENLQIIWVELDPRCDPWTPGREHGLRLHYLLWLRAALRAAADLCYRTRIDVIHHVSWNTISAPPPFWKLQTPFVWGPVGGGHLTPAEFRSYIGAVWKSERFRNARLSLLPYTPVLRRTVRSTSRLLTSNRETYRVLQQAGASSPEMCLDCALPPSAIPAFVEAPNPSTELRVIWAGRLKPKKCLPLILEAMAQVPDIQVHLTVAGEGEQRLEWERLVQVLNLSGRVVFTGNVPHSQMPALFRASDVFAFTSLCDTFGTVLLEAMAQGLPIIGLDHQGLGAFVPRDAAMKIPVIRPAETVRALAQALRDCVKHPEHRREMGLAAWRFARQNTWATRAEEMANRYEEVVRANRHI